MVIEYIKMRKNKWCIPTISTDDYAKEFAKLLKNGSNKTFFLQGRWGSGKTEYLKNVEEQANGKLKFIYLELWKPDFNESLSRQIFAATHPILDPLATTIGYIFIALTIICSSILAVKGVIQRNLPNYVFTIVTIILAIITNLFSLTKNKLINVDKIRMFWSILTLRKNSENRSNVLIIDDFDRLSKKIQEELYRLFNAIQKKGSKARIVFVGDLQKIEASKNDFLTKIIDQVIALPFVLSPQSFSPEIENIISENLDDNSDIAEISNLFVTENRTLRDANHFLSYVEDEFCRQDKKDRIQTVQQLLIIYLYLFYKDKYNELYQNCKNNDYIKKYRKDRSNKKSNSFIDKEIDRILTFDKKYPYGFWDNPTMYFIDESAVTIPITKLLDFVKDTKSLRKLAFSENPSSGYESIYEMLIAFLDSPTSNEQFNLQFFNEITEASTFAMIAEPYHKPNQLIKNSFHLLEDYAFEYVLKTYDLSEFEEESLDYLYFFLEEKISGIEEKYTLTEELYVLRVGCLQSLITYHPKDAISFPSINKYSVAKYFLPKCREIENKSNFGKNIYDAEALLVEFCFKKPEENITDLKYKALNPPTIESKVEKIEQLADYEYVSFWKAYLDDIEIAKETDILIFEYRNKNYGNFVYDRYENIIDTCCDCFTLDLPSFGEKISVLEKLQDLFFSSDWVDFTLKLAAIKRQFNMRGRNSKKAKKVIVSSINTLLNSYKFSEQANPLRSNRDKYDDENLYRILNNLLNKVNADPYWTRKLK